MNKLTTSLNVKIIYRFATLYRGVAKSVSASDDTGSFDILPGHENFLALLRQGNIKVDSSQGIKNLNIEHGIIHVTDDFVEIFVDI